MVTTDATWVPCDEPPHETMVELAGGIYTEHRVKIEWVVLSYDDGFGRLLVYKREVKTGPLSSQTTWWSRLI